MVIKTKTKGEENPIPIQSDRVESSTSRHLSHSNSIHNYNKLETYIYRASTQFDLTKD